MTVAPLIAMKSTKCESLEAVGKELDRRSHTYANDVDQSGRHIGYCCRADDAHPLPLDKAVERRMGELNTKRKIRDNAVRAMGFIVSSNDALDEKSAREFLDRSVNWFGARYGYENLLAAQIHLDEGTPHAHIWIAPVIHDRETGFDRLCAKELFAPDKRRKNAEGKWEVVAQGTMSRLQEDFWEQVSKPYGYERPLRHELRAKGYRSLDAYKVQVGTTRALKSEIETLEGARDKAKRGAITAKRELDGLEQLRVESHVKLGAVTAKVDEKQAQAAEIDRRIAEKWPSSTAWTAKSARKSSFAMRWAITSSASSGDWSRFGKRRDGLRRTLRSWKPSLPSLTSSTTRDALRSAESSMKSLLDAMDCEDELSRSLRESEERLDGLRWQLRTSPESSGREVRG